MLGYQRKCQGCQIRPILRCLQYSTHHVCGCARILARNESRVWRHHSTWSQATLCLCRGHCSKDYRHYQKGESLCTWSVGNSSDCDCNGRLMVVPTMSWLPSIYEETSTMPGPRLRLPSWVARGPCPSFSEVITIRTYNQFISHQHHYSLCRKGVRETRARVRGEI